MLNENLCDKNALAKQLEDFLVRHGGRDGNLLGDAAKGQGDNLNELVCKTLARYELDSRAAADEVKGCSKLLERCKAELAKQNEVLVFETARADEAERAAEEWQRRHGALRDAAAARIAQLEVENAWLQAEAGSGLVEAYVTARRFDLAKRQLDGVLASGKKEEGGLAATLLEALGITDRDGVLQQLEMGAMRREELDQRTAAALTAATAAGFGKKKTPSKKR